MDFTSLCRFSTDEYVSSTGCHVALPFKHGRPLNGAAIREVHVIDCTDVDALVFDSSLSPGETEYKESLPDGRTVTRKVRISTGRGEMEEVTQEGPERDEVKVESEEEVLPDGTVHQKHHIIHHKLKHIKRSTTSQSGDEEVYEADEEVPGSAKTEVLETYDQPAHLVQEMDEIEQVLPDGTKVKRHVVMNRMVHLIKTHHESFDEEHGKTEEDFEIEEVVPGTESAFVAGVDSDYEEEMEQKKKATMGELEQVMDDGTVVAQKLMTSETTTRTRSRSGSVDETVEQAYVTEERVTPSPSPRSGSPKLVSYEHGSAVDGEDPYDYSGKTVLQSTVRTGHYDETSSKGVVESTADVVEDMISKGQLQLEEDTAAPLECRELDDTGLVKRLVTKVTYTPRDVTTTAESREADTDTPVITITEDLSTPPEEDEDVLSYFGVKYEPSSEVEHPEDTQEYYDQADRQQATDTAQYVPDEPPQQEQPPPGARDFEHEPVVESVSEYTQRTSFGTEYRKTEIEVTKKETVITERVVHKEESSVSVPETEEPVKRVEEAVLTSQRVEETEAQPEAAETLEQEQIEAQQTQTRDHEEDEYEEAAFETAEEVLDEYEVPERQAFQEQPEEAVVETTQAKVVEEREESPFEVLEPEEEFEEASEEMPTEEEFVEEVVQEKEIPPIEAEEYEECAMPPEEEDRFVEVEEERRVVDDVSEAAPAGMAEEETREEIAEAREVSATMAGVCLVPEEEEVEEEVVEAKEAPAAPMADVCVVPEEEEAKEEVIQPSEVAPAMAGEAVEEESESKITETIETEMRFESEEEAVEEKIESREAETVEAETCLVPEEEAEEEEIQTKVAETVESEARFVQKEEAEEEDIVSKVAESVETATCLVPEEEEVEEEIERKDAGTVETETCLVPEEEAVKEEVESKVAEAVETETCLAPEEEAMEEEIESEIAKTAETETSLVKEEEAVEEEIESKVAGPVDTETYLVPEEEAVEEEIVSKVTEPVETETCLVPEEEAVEEEVESKVAETVETETCLVPEEEAVEEVEGKVAEPVETETCLVPEEEAVEEEVESKVAETVETESFLVPQEEAVEEAIESKIVEPVETETCLVPEEEAIEEEMESKIAETVETETCLVPEEEAAEEEIESTVAETVETESFLVPEEEAVEEEVESKVAETVETETCLVPEAEAAEEEVESTVAETVETESFLVPEEEAVEEEVESKVAETVETETCLVPEEEAAEEEVESTVAETVETEPFLVPEEEAVEEAIESKVAEPVETETFLVPEEEAVEEAIEKEETVEEEVESKVAETVETETCLVPEEEAVEEEIESKAAETLETETCLVPEEEAVEEEVESKAAEPVETETCLVPDDEAVEEEIEDKVAAETEAELHIVPEDTDRDLKDLEAAGGQLDLEEEEEDEWEILDKDELTEEEEIAALDQLLMQPGYVEQMETIEEDRALSEDRQTPETTETYQKTEEHYESSVTETYQYRESTTEGVEGAFVEPSVEREEREEEHERDTLTAEGAKEEISDEELVEQQMSPVQLAFQPSASELLEQKLSQEKEEEGIQQKTEDYEIAEKEVAAEAFEEPVQEEPQELFEELQETGKEKDEEEEELGISKPSEVSLDGMSEVVSIHDETDRTYQFRVDEGIMQEARHEMEGDAMEVVVMSGSPTLDKGQVDLVETVEGLAPEEDVEEPPSEIEAKTDEPESEQISGEFHPMQTEVETEHEYFYEETVQTQYKAEEVCEDLEAVRETVTEVEPLAEPSYEISQVEKEAFETLKSEQVEVPVSLETIEGVAAEQELTSSPGSKASEISPVQEDKVEAIAVEEYAETVQEQEVYVVEEIPPAADVMDQELEPEMPAKHEEQIFAAEESEMFGEEKESESQVEEKVEQQILSDTDEATKATEELELSPEEEEREVAPPAVEIISHELQQFREGKFQREDTSSFDETTTQEEVLSETAETQEEKVEETEKMEELLVAAMPDVPQQSPRMSPSDAEVEERSETFLEPEQLQEKLDVAEQFEERLEEELGDTQKFEEAVEQQDREESPEEPFEESLEAQEVTSQPIPDIQLYDSDARSDRLGSGSTLAQTDVDTLQAEEQFQEGKSGYEEIEEQDALTAALMYQYHPAQAKEEPEIPEQETPAEEKYTGFLAPDDKLAEGGSGYESEEEEEGGFEKFEDELGEIDREKEPFDSLPSEEDREEADVEGQLKETEHEEHLLETRHEEQLFEAKHEYTEYQYKETFTQEFESRTTDEDQYLVSKETDKLAEAAGQQQIVVESYESFLSDEAQQARADEESEPLAGTEGAQAAAMSQSVDSTEAQMASSGEGMLLSEPCRQEYDLMALSGATDDSKAGDQERDFGEDFVMEREEDDRDDLYEHYSSESEEELKPLKMPVAESPTDQPTPADDFEETEEAERFEAETEFRPSPTLGRSSEQKPYESPTEEQPVDFGHESPTLDQTAVTETEEKPESPTQERDFEVRYEETEEKQQEEVIEEKQQAVSGILAEMQALESYAGKAESEDELEDGLEQYESEELEGEEREMSQQQVEQVIREQTLITEQYSEIKHEFHEEHVTFTETTDTFTETALGPEGTVREERYEYQEQVGTKEAATEDGQTVEEEQLTDLSTLEQFVDRKETFTTEEREISVSEREPEPTVESEEKEEDQIEEELSTNVYVDRTERFVEEEVEVLAREGDVSESGIIVGAPGQESDGGAAEPSLDQQPRLSAQSSLSGPDNHYQEMVNEQHLALHPPPLYPSSSTEVQDRSGTPSDLEQEEPVQNGLAATAFAGSYTSELTSTSQSYISESTVSHMSESDYTSHSETWAASECTMTGSEFEPEGRITVDTAEQIFIEQTIEETHREEEHRQSEMDLLDRPMSPSEYTLTTSHDHDRMMQRDSLQSDESDEVMSEDERQSERPPSPTEYTLIASQDSATLSHVLGLQASPQPHAERAPVEGQEPVGQAALAKELEGEGFDGTQEARGQDDQFLDTYLETQSSGSSEQALIQMLDYSADTNSISNFSSDREFGAGSERDFETQPQLEPTAPYMPPSPTTEGQPLSSSYENLYRGVSLEPEVPMEPLSAKDLDIGDRFDSRQTEPHLQGLGRTSSFEQLYTAGLPPEDTALTHAGEAGVVTTEAGAAGGPLAAEAAVQDDDKLSSSSGSEVAQLEDVEDQDAEIQETSKEKTEETDVEEQFSPLSKGSPSKHVFSFSETSELEMHMQALHSETVSQTSTLTFPSKEVAEDVREEPHDRREKLIYATESFEKFEEETAQFSERTVLEESVSAQTAEVSEVTATATVQYETPATTEIAEETELSVTDRQQEKTVEEKPEEEGESEDVHQESRLTYMAFDNMGFFEGDAREEEEQLKPRQLSKQETRDISPEDLEEKPYTFDFPDDFKEELEAQQQYEATYCESTAVSFEAFGARAGDREQVFSDEEEEHGAQDTEQGDVVLSYEADAGDTGTYLIEVEEKETYPDESVVTARTVEEIQTTSETSYDERQASSGEVQPAEATEVASSESSSDHDIEVFDELVGAYVKMPWEIAHQYKRQFSESYIEQEKKLSHFQQIKSIDMGTFYRRDDDDYPNVTFTQQAEDTVFVEKILEPYDQIEYTHEEEVITTIQESRMHVKEEIAREPVFDADYLDTPLSAAAASGQASAAIFESLLYQSATEEMATSYATAHSSLEMSAERRVSSDVEEEMSAMLRQQEPVCVVSKESRLAQQELLQEMADEGDRSVSPSRDSEELPPTYESHDELHAAIAEEPETESHPIRADVPTSFPMAVHTLGKALADNDVYESSETEKDSTEEKLSPIDEAPGVDDIEEDEAPVKTVPAEKRVTFQTDTLGTPRASEQSVDDYKMSTSSSEISVEPTLLAASYDLDTGRVCHVVSAYDVSPDTVEKKLTPTTPAKSILSSPEDDVFETDASITVRSEKLETPTRDDFETLEQLGEASSDFIPSPPAPTPRDGGQVPSHVAIDLAEASSVLEHMKIEPEDEDQEAGQTLDESTVHEEDELSSPFEMMSPKVEYLPEYDAELEQQQQAPFFAETKEPEAELEQTEAQVGAQEEEEEEESELPVPVWDATEENGKGLSPSGVDATLSELQLHPGLDAHMSTSEQTLYGLDMPSDEAFTMSASLQREMQKSEVDQDSDLTLPPTEVTFQTDEQMSEQMETSAEMKASSLFESTEGFIAAEAPEVEAVPEQQQVWEEKEAGLQEEQEEQRLEEFEEESVEPPESPLPEEAEEQPYQLDPESVYPGKRALEVEIFQGEDRQKELQEEEEIAAMPFEITREAEQEEPIPEVRIMEEEEMGEEDLLAEAAGGEEEFMEQEAEEIEYMEKPEEELLRLKDSKPESEDEGEEEQEDAAGAQADLLGVQGYEDLERPLSPTPDVFRQMFFAPDSETESPAPPSEKETESPAPAAPEEEILEKTASHFVESILEDVKEKQTKTTVLMKQVSEDIPGITITEHLSSEDQESDLEEEEEEEDETDYPISPDDRVKEEYMQATQADVDERFEESEEDVREMDSSQEWPKLQDGKETELSSSVESDRYDSKDNELSSSVESDRYGSNVELSSSVESDRYEFVDRAALSVITELSEEEQFEMIEKDELGNETGPDSDTQEQFHCSPENISQSPVVGTSRFFNKNGTDKDDVSVSSSLLEFERLEKQMAGGSGSSSIETSDKESLFGSYDERKLQYQSGSSWDEKKVEYGGSYDEKKLLRYKREMERDNISATSSLAEFETLEREIDQQGSSSSVDKFSHESKSSGGGHLYGYSSSDLSEGEGKREPDKDSLDDKDALEHDSLSEGEKEGELDSLDGDTSEMTEMTSSVIFAGPEPTAAQPGVTYDMDADSLAGECIMQLSSDSLTLNQQLRTSDSSRFDTDSLFEQEDVMVRSVDSLEQEKHSDKCDQDSLQEDVMHTSADSLELAQVEQMPDNLMLMSVESAHWSMGSSGGTARSTESHTDSHDFMQVSAESVEELKMSRSEQTLKTELTQSTEVIEESRTVARSVRTTQGAKPHPTNPFLDDEGNIMESSTYSLEDDDEEDDLSKEKESPFMSWGPYREEKKVYTMAEWEALKRDRQRDRQEIVSTEAATKLSEPRGDSVEGAEAPGSDGMQTHRMVMKKEVHKRTMIHPDGQEETTIREDSQIHQDSEPPEELRDSMQQIINQFMEQDPEVPMIKEDEAKAVDEGTEV
ncbi:hypothetical protein BaRGS_00002581 [Batillaria attramentaria]|uniref:Titin n=1 Tax=Batillaria attramentaria TaxID=370345 RepID=A0ABD0M516_9CAEN